jgi:hypothetical protein
MISVIIESPDRERSTRFGSSAAPPNDMLRIAGAMTRSYRCLNSGAKLIATKIS